MPLNFSILKEFIILVAGPIFQTLASFFLILIMPSNKDLILAYHNGILFFNLLPIYPLDGGKIINLIFSLFFPFKLSLKYSIYISYFVLITILFIKKSFTINIVVILVLSLILITKEKRKINQLYNKFILERYLNNYNFKNSKMVNNINNFYRSRRHLVKENDNYYLEKDYLIKKYQKFTKNRWLLKKCYAIINLSLGKVIMGH